MARVYSRERGDALERAFLRLLGPRRRRRTGLEGLRKVVLVFSVCFAVVYGIQRLQGHLFLNPDHMKGVPSHVALNTAASFVTNTNWQYYGGEFTMSYLTQMAALAVQNFVSAGSGWRCSPPSCAASPRAAARPRQLLARPLPLDRLRPAASRRSCSR